MENKPNHYDGSVQINENLDEDLLINEEFQVTDDMRKFISGNPFRIN